MLFRKQSEMIFNRRNPCISWEFALKSGGIQKEFLNFQMKRKWAILRSIRLQGLFIRFISILTFYDVIWYDRVLLSI